MTAPAASRRSSTSRTPARHSAVGGTLLGVFIGIVVGLGLAAGVAYWLMKNNPALPLPTLSKDAHEPAGDGAKAAKSDAADKPRFDFYKILPGVEDAKPQPERRSAPTGDRGVAEQARDRSVGGSGERPADNAPARGADRPATPDTQPKPAKPGDHYWLQAGSFSAAPDAENLKARLALAGLEATVQQGSLPDKGVRYRVRLGPYDNADEIGRMKAELAKRGFDVAVIKF